MATKTKDESTGSSLLDSMEVEEELNIPLRGRGYDPDVIAIRETLEQSLTDRKARSFKNVEEGDRETYARKVRTAGEMKGKPTIKVATRYDKHSKKLIWGPDEVLREMAGQAPKSSDS